MRQSPLDHPDRSPRPHGVGIPLGETALGHLLEIQGGVEYESCCWAFRTVLRRYLKNRDGDYRDGIYLELNLKGLASIGSGSRNLF